MTFDYFMPSSENRERHVARRAVKKDHTTSLFPNKHGDGINGDGKRQAQAGCRGCAHRAGVELPPRAFRQVDLARSRVREDGRDEIVVAEEILVLDVPRVRVVLVVEREGRTTGTPVWTAARAAAAISFVSEACTPAYVA